MNTPNINIPTIEVAVQDATWVNLGKFLQALAADKETYHINVSEGALKITPASLTGAVLTGYYASSSKLTIDITEEAVVNIDETTIKRVCREIIRMETNKVSIRYHIPDQPATKLLRVMKNSPEPATVFTKLGDTELTVSVSIRLFDQAELSKVVNWLNALKNAGFTPIEDEGFFALDWLIHHQDPLAWESVAWCIGTSPDAVGDASSTYAIAYKDNGQAVIYGDRFKIVSAIKRGEFEPADL